MRWGNLPLYFTQAAPLSGSSIRDFISIVHACMQQRAAFASEEVGVSSEGRSEVYDYVSLFSSISFFLVFIPAQVSGGGTFSSGVKMLVYK